jgi:hypothetical protein
MKRWKAAVLLLVVGLVRDVRAVTQKSQGETAYVSDTPTGNSTTLLKVSTASKGVLCVWLIVACHEHCVNQAYAEHSWYGLIFSRCTALDPLKPAVLLLL